MGKNWHLSIYLCFKYLFKAATINKQEKPDDIIVKKMLKLLAKKLLSGARNIKRYNIVGDNFWVKRGVFWLYIIFLCDSLTFVHNAH